MAAFILLVVGLVTAIGTTTAIYAPIPSSTSSSSFTTDPQPASSPAMVLKNPGAYPTTASLSSASGITPNRETQESITSDSVSTIRRRSVPGYGDSHKGAYEEENKPYENGYYPHQQTYSHRKYDSRPYGAGEGGYQSGGSGSYSSPNSYGYGYSLHHLIDDFVCDLDASILVVTGNEKHIDSYGSEQPSNDYSNNAAASYEPKNGGARSGGYAKVEERKKRVARSKKPEPGPPGTKPDEEKKPDNHKSPYTKSKKHRHHKKQPGKKGEKKKYKGGKGGIDGKYAGGAGYEHANKIPHGAPNYQYSGNNGEYPPKYAYGDAYEGYEQENHGGDNYNYGPQESGDGYPPPHYEYGSYDQQQSGEYGGREGYGYYGNEGEEGAYGAYASNEQPNYESGGYAGNNEDGYEGSYGEEKKEEGYADADYNNVEGGGYGYKEKPAPPPQQSVAVAHRLRCSVIATKSDEECTTCCQLAARRDRSISKHSIIGFIVDYDQINTGNYGGEYKRYKRGAVNLKVDVNTDDWDKSDSPSAPAMNWPPSTSDTSNAKDATKPAAAGPPGVVPSSPVASAPAPVANHGPLPIPNPIQQHSHASSGIQQTAEPSSEPESYAPEEDSASPAGASATPTYPNTDYSKTYNSPPPPQFPPSNPRCVCCAPKQQSEHSNYYSNHHNSYKQQQYLRGSASYGGNGGGHHRYHKEQPNYNNKPYGYTGVLERGYAGNE